MKVMVIVKANKDSESGKMPSQQMLTDMGKFNEELVKAGVLLAGEGLHPSSRGLRVGFKGKERYVIDGPFAETKELIAGFWLWKVKSMAEAIDWLKRCPNPHEEPTEVEIRQVFSADDFGGVYAGNARTRGKRSRQGLGLGAVRFETGHELVIAGINCAYDAQSRTKIPGQWQRFAPQIGKVPGQMGTASYGVCWNVKADCTFDYLTGVEVAPSAKLPADFTRVALPAGRYAVITHTGHIAALPQTIDKIWAQWVPDAGLKTAKTPCFERYTEKFDAKSGHGEVEIWVPLEGKAH